MLVEVPQLIDKLNAMRSAEVLSKATARPSKSLYTITIVAEPHAGVFSPITVETTANIPKQFTLAFAVVRKRKR